MRETIIEIPEVKIELEIAHGIALVHVEVYKWSHNLFKEFIEIWAEVLNTLHRHEIPVINALVPVNDTKLFKFATHFGFVPSVGPLKDQDGNIYLLMSQNTNGTSRTVHPAVHSGSSDDSPVQPSESTGA